MSRRGDQLRAAFVAHGIPADYADEALAKFPSAHATQEDVNRLLNIVGYPANYGTVKELDEPGGGDGKPPKPTQLPSLPEEG